MPPRGVDRHLVVRMIPAKSVETRPKRFAGKIGGDLTPFVGFHHSQAFIPFRRLSTTDRFRCGYEGLGAVVRLSAWQYTDRGQF